MNKYNNLIKKNNLKVNKITIKRNAYIIDTPLGKFVIKDNKGTKIYDYLLSRGFNYFPNIIDYDNEGILFEYIDEVSYNADLKALDFIKLLSLLHVKTSCFIDITIDEYKTIYETVNNNLNYLNNYYNNLINIIESREYMSPSEYLLSRNISIIFGAINYSVNKLNEWYNLVKNKQKKRVVTLYNNIDINNLIKSREGTYLTSLDKTITDSPIYDLLSFYKRYELDFDFVSLLKAYEKVLPLLEEEEKLFLLLISIPEKIEINDDINSFHNIKRKIDRVYNNLNILKFKEEENKHIHKKEDNK